MECMNQKGLGVDILLEMSIVTVRAIVVDRLATIIGEAADANGATAQLRIDPTRCEAVETIIRKIALIPKG